MAADDRNVRKLHPWLRVVRNGDRVVNATRSDGSTRMACSVSAAETGVPSAPIYEQFAQQSVGQPRWTSAVEEPAEKLSRRRKLYEGDPAADSYVNVFIEFLPERLGATDADQQAAMAKVAADIVEQTQNQKAAQHIPTAVAIRRNFLSATVAVSMLPDLQENDAIAFIHKSDALKLHRPEVQNATNTKPAAKAIAKAKELGIGADVLIGIIDVGGFDFSHPDFLTDDGTTRFVAIWDQGGDFRQSPKNFPYGAEFTHEQLNRALQKAKKPGTPPPTWIERQSQMQPGSHGTHVASIAAGKFGVCPEAEIAAVLIDIPTPEDDVQRRRATFSDSSRIAHAVEYLLQVAEKRRKPIAINISLGTNGGAHDGSAGVSRWLDAYLASPGRAICVAAGNAGQEKPEGDGDFGWIMGRIHTSGQIPARGLEVEIGWTVVGDGIEDVSENELEIWYGAQDRFSVSVKPPSGSTWITAQPREFVENQRLEPSGVTVSIYNELYHPTNGGNYIAIYLSPNLDPDEFRGIPAGVWRVRLRGEEVRDGRYDA